MTNRNNTNRHRNTPKPGHRAPGGMYVDTQEGWNHLVDTTPTQPADSSPTTDSSPASSSGE